MHIYAVQKNVFSEFASINANCTFWFIKIDLLVELTHKRLLISDKKGNGFRRKSFSFKSNTINYIFWFCIKQVFCLTLFRLGGGGGEGF